MREPVLSVCDRLATVCVCVDRCSVSWREAHCWRSPLGALFHTTHSHFNQIKQISTSESIMLELSERERERAWEAECVCVLSLQKV